MKKEFKMILVVIAVCAVAITVIAVALFMQGSGRKYDRHLKLAKQYLEELNYEQAIAELRAAIKIDPKNRRAYRELAEVYVEMEDYESAIEVLRTGIAEAGGDELEEYLLMVQSLFEMLQAEADSGSGAGNPALSTGGETEPGTETGDGAGGENSSNGEENGEEEISFAVEVKKTEIQADSLYNTEGYGGLRLDSSYDESSEESIPPRFALIDQNGEFVFEYGRFPCAYSLSDGLFVNGDYERYEQQVLSGFSDDFNAYSIYNLKGEQVIDQFYDWMSDLSDGYVLAEKAIPIDYGIGRERIIIDASGKKICSLSGGLIYAGWSDHLFEKKYNSYGFTLKYNNCGEGLINISYIEPLKKGNISEVIGSEELEGDLNEDFGFSWYSAYMDLNGNIVIPGSEAFSDRGGKFCGGLAWAGDRESGLWGYINKEGTWAISAQYAIVSDFCEGYAYVADADGKYGYIDTEGKVVIPPEYDGAFGHASGLFVVGKIVDGVTKYGAVDRKNQIVVPIEYDDISTFEEHVGYGIKDGCVCVIHLVPADGQE